MPPRNSPNPLVRPFLKWAGGKRQLLPELLKHIPKQYGSYYEPFLGGGALFLALQPRRAVVNDSNGELINCYQVVQKSVEDLIQLLHDHQAHNNEDYYYGMRDWDRSEGYAARPAIERAARIIYLNKTCYNGLFRVNAQGQFNVPYGKYARPAIVDEGVLRAVSHYLDRATITFRTMDFAEATQGAQAGDFLYFDPPYDPISSTASFTGYDVNGFDRSEQERLHQHVDALNAHGCQVMLSNAYTPFIVRLYQDYHCIKVEATRAINSDPGKRGKVDEILVVNYDQRPNQKRHRMGNAVSAASHPRGGEPLWPVRDQLDANQ
ncbi:MAG: DNA adenine methylase [Ktedonobacterales bacterium]